MTVSVANRQNLETANMSVVSVAGQVGPVTLPPGVNALTAQFLRHGDDLELVLANGQHVLLPGFFIQAAGHDLVMDGGLIVSAHAVQALAGPLAPARIAQADGNGGATHDGLIQVGLVDKITGTATVKHADGTSEPLTHGTIVYQDDVVETGPGSSVGLIFADSSTFSLGAAGRMVLDEVLYDPGSKTGHAQLEVLTGGFSLVSGQIAKTSPNAMSVKTPVMTIAVRGTTVAGQVSEKGETAVALLADPSGNIGQVSISNSSGIQVLSQPNTLVTLTSAFQAPPPPVVVPPSYVQQTFGQTLNSLPVPPPAGSMEWSTKPGAQQAPPVQQLQNREGANKVVDPTSSTGTKEAPPQEGAAAKPEGKAEAKPDAKADGKAEGKTEGKAEEGKADAKTEGKAEGKADGKAEGKAEGKEAEGKAEGKAEEGKADAKAETKAEGKEADTKPETKAEGKEPAAATGPAGAGTATPAPTATPEAQPTPTTTPAAPAGGTPATPGPASTGPTSFLSTPTATTTAPTGAGSSYLNTVTSSSFVSAATGVNTGGNTGGTTTVSVVQAISKETAKVVETATTGNVGNTSTTTTNNNDDAARKAAEAKAAQDAAAAGSQTSTGGTQTDSGSSGSGGSTGGGDSGSGSSGGNVTIPSSSGRVVDGPVSGALVFRDSNGNYSFDNGEYHTVTDGSGNFTLQGTGGTIVAMGGVDTVTGLALTAPLIAAAGASVVTPLTTLLSLGVPANIIASMLGLPASTDFNSLDPTGNSSAQQGSMQILAAIQTMNNSLDALGATGVDSYDLFQSLASQISTTSGTLDLTSTSTFTTVLSNATSLSSSNAILQSLASVAATASKAAQLAAQSNSYGGLNNLASQDVDSLIKTGVILTPSEAASTTFLNLGGVEDIEVSIAETSIFTANTTQVVISQIPSGALIKLNGTPLTVTSGSVTLDSSQVTSIRGGTSLEFVSAPNSGDDATLKMVATINGQAQTFITQINMIGNTDPVALNMPTTSASGTVSTAIPLGDPDIGQTDSSETGWVIISNIPATAQIKLNGIALHAAGETSVTISRDVFNGIDSSTNPLTIVSTSSGTFILTVTAYTQDGSDSPLTDSGTIEVTVNPPAAPNYTLDMSAAGNLSNSSGTASVDTFTLDITSASPVAGAIDADVTLTNTDGSDILDVTDVDTNGFSWAQTGLQRSGNDLILTFNDLAGGGSVTIVDQFNGKGIQKIVSTAPNDSWESHIKTVSPSTAANAYDQMIFGTAAAETLLGGTGDDDLYGGGGSDILNGGAGDDTADLSALTGPFVMSNWISTLGVGSGVVGSDTLTLINIDEIVGTSANDVLYGLQVAGNGQYMDLTGAGGNDTLIGSQTSYWGIEADYGEDSAGITAIFDWATSGTYGAWNVSSQNTMVGMVTQGGSVGTDTLVGIYQLQGTGGNDSVTVNNTLTVYNGTYFSFNFDGGMGDDTFIGTADGRERISYYTSNAGVTVDLSAGTATDGWGGTDSLTAIDDVTGSDFNDSLTGSSGDNMFFGDYGNDNITTGNGYDSIAFHAADADDLSGLGSDTVTDFSTADDQLWFGGTYFTTYLQGAAKINSALTSSPLDAGNAVGGLLYYVNGGDTEVWFTTNMSASTTSNSHKIATLQGTTITNASEIALSLDGVQTQFDSDSNDAFSTSSGNVAYGYSLSDFRLSFSYGSNLIVTVTDTTSSHSGVDTIQVDDTGKKIIFSNTELTLGSSSLTDKSGASTTLHIGDVSSSVSLDMSDGTDSVYFDAAKTISTGSSLQINGGSGNDSLTANGTGIITFVGGAGNDALIQSGADSTIIASYAGHGAAITVTYASANAATAFDGTDTDSLTGVHTFIGTGYNDNITGGDGNEYVYASAGADTFDGAGGIDWIDFTGKSAITMGAHIDTSSGGTVGNFQSVSNIEGIRGTSNADVLYGSSAGTMFLDGAGGSDTLIGHLGLFGLLTTADYSRFSSGIASTLAWTTTGSSGGWDFSTDPTYSGTVASGSDTDTLIAIGTILGSGHNDTITVNSVGADFITIQGNGGNDTLTGAVGGGNIFLSYAESEFGAMINLVDGTAQDGWGDIDALSHFRHVIGTAYDDEITLTGDDNTVFSGKGTDTITTGNGYDLVVIDSGDTVLSLSALAALGHDYVTDFSAANDKLFLRGATFNTVRAMANTGTDITASAQNLGTAGIHGLVYKAVGGGGTEIWYTEDLGSVTSSNSTKVMVSQTTLTPDTIKLGLSMDYGDFSYTQTMGSYELSINGATEQETITVTDRTANRDGTIQFMDINSSAKLAFSGTDSLSFGWDGDMIIDTATGLNSTLYIKDMNSSVSLRTGDGNDLVILSTLGTGSGYLAVFGQEGDDTLVGGGLDNVVFMGGADNDTLISGTGDETLNGGLGTDTAVYASSTTGITVAGDMGTVTGSTGAGTDTLVDIENIVGSAFNDVLYGNASANFLYGGAGDDYIFGGGGAGTTDTLVGGQGADTLIGMAGIDLFVLGRDTTTIADLANAGIDRMDYTITDNDQIVLDGVLKTLNLSGNVLTSATTLSGSGVDYNGGSGSAAGVLLIGNSTGADGVQVWYTDDLNNASTTNSYQIGLLENINTTQVNTAHVVNAP